MTSLPGQDSHMVLLSSKYAHQTTLSVSLCTEKHKVVLVVESDEKGRLVSQEPTEMRRVSVRKADYKLSRSMWVSACPASN